MALVEKHERLSSCEMSLQHVAHPRELANFMGQVQHESQNFTRLEENLNYSGSRLYDVFPRRNGLTREGAQSIDSLRGAHA